MVLNQAIFRGHPSTGQAGRQWECGQGGWIRLVSPMCWEQLLLVLKIELEAAAATHTPPPPPSCSLPPSQQDPAIVCSSTGLSLPGT